MNTNFADSALLLPLNLYGEKRRPFFSGLTRPVELCCRTVEARRLQDCMQRSPAIPRIKYVKHRHLPGADYQYLLEEHP